ncbi:MAG: hypothetical protein ABWZ99_14705, partial [Ilumatobacteraceae bacterium]
MSSDRRIAPALGALLATVVVVVGVPLVLLAVVGNPWPGRGRVEMRDEVGLVVGVLAVLAWLVWLRFVLALVVELRTQVAELRSAARPASTGRVHLAAPARSRTGVGLVAQRLVAAILILLPVAGRVGSAIAESPGPLGGGRVQSALVVDAPHQLSTVAAPSPVTAATATGSVLVAPCDKLIGLYSRELGEADRWREIFEINKDRPQADGARLTSPSA